MSSSIFDDIQHYCPAHRVCKETGNFSEKTCKYANNTERKMTIQCAAGIMMMLEKLLAQKK